MILVCIHFVKSHDFVFPFFFFFLINPFVSYPLLSVKIYCLIFHVTLDFDQLPTLEIPYQLT